MVIKQKNFLVIKFALNYYNHYPRNDLNVHDFTSFKLKLNLSSYFQHSDYKKCFLSTNSNTQVIQQYKIILSSLYQIPALRLNSNIIILPNFITWRNLQEIFISNIQVYCSFNFFFVTPRHVQGTIPERPPPPFQEKNFSTPSGTKG